MNRSLTIPVLALFRWLFRGAAVRRGLVDDVFVSEANPPLRVRIDPAFTYLGYTAFEFNGRVAVDRHHWVRAVDGEVLALIVLQFEGFRDGVDGCIMSRFVTEIGSEHRHELILFYLEPLHRHGVTLADVPTGGPPSQIFDRVAASVTERSLATLALL